MLSCLRDFVEERLALALDLIERKGGMLCDIGEQLERFAEVARQGVNVQGRDVAARLRGVDGPKLRDLVRELSRVA